MDVTLTTRLPPSAPVYTGSTVSPVHQAPSISYSSTTDKSPKDTILAINPPEADFALGQLHYMDRRSVLNDQPLQAGQKTDAALTQIKRENLSFVRQLDGVGSKLTHDQPGFVVEKIVKEMIGTKDGFRRYGVEEPIYTATAETKKAKYKFGGPSLDEFLTMGTVTPKQGSLVKLAALNTQLATSHVAHPVQGEVLYDSGKLPAPLLRAFDALSLTAFRSKTGALAVVSTPGIKDALFMDVLDKPANDTGSKTGVVALAFTPAGLLDHFKPEVVEMRARMQAEMTASKPKPSFMPRGPESYGRAN